MSHTYASVPRLKDYITDGGGSSSLLGTTLDEALLGILEAASRAVDRYCDRSDFGSGFGPRIGTNKYDGRNERGVDLRDDLLSITTVTLLDRSNGTSLGTPVADTDYVLVDRSGHNTTPYREFVLHGEGSLTSVGYGYLVSSFAGKWGYQDVQSSVGTAGTVTASATSVTLTGGSAYAGHTILLDSEQMYVTASTGGTALTVTRAANGTTAAQHAASSAATIYKYPPEVVDATLQIALRRWKSRDAGADGSYGGGQLPGQVPAFAASEMSILHRTVGHLKFFGVG